MRPAEPNVHTEAVVVVATVVRLKNVPPTIVQEVLDFIEFLEIKHRIKASGSKSRILSAF